MKKYLLPSRGELGARCPPPSSLPGKEGMGAAADSVGGGPIPIRSHRSFPPWGFTEIKQRNLSRYFA